MMYLIRFIPSTVNEKKLKIFQTEIFVNEDADIDEDEDPNGSSEVANQDNLISTPDKNNLLEK